MSETQVIEADVVEETEESRAVAVVPAMPTSLAVAPEIGADELVARMAVIQQAAEVIHLRPGVVEERTDGDRRLHVHPPRGHAARGG